MQVINFANPISPAQRSWVQEGGNFLLVALSLLPTPPTPRDTRLFEILDFRTNSRVPVSRVGRGGFISKRATIIRFQSIRLIGSFSLNSTPVHRFPPPSNAKSRWRLRSGPILCSLKCNLEEKKKKKIRFYLLRESIVIDTSMSLEF